MTDSAQFDRGRRLQIPRSDGTVQEASIIDYNPASHKIHVEWHQDDHSKSKWVSVADVLSLNPELAKQTTASTPPQQQQSDDQSTQVLLCEKRLHCAQCDQKFSRESWYKKHIEANKCADKSSKPKRSKRSAKSSSDSRKIVLPPIEDEDNDEERTERCQSRAPGTTNKLNTNHTQPTQCAYDTCKNKTFKGQRGLAQHIRCCHPEEVRGRLIDAAPHIVPAQQLIDDATKQIDKDRAATQLKFFPKFLALAREASMQTSNNDDDFWQRFETAYKEFVRHLLGLQPQFYNSPKRKKTKQKGKHRRSTEEVDAAREAFKFREAQFNFHNDMRSLRRQIYGADIDPATFTSDELYDYFNNVFGQSNNKIASIDLMPFDVLDDERRDVDVIVGEQNFQIEPAEVLKALRGLSNEVAAGPDRLRVKTIKTYDNDGKILALIFSTCFACKKIPSDWKRGSTPVLPKPRKNAALLENRRPITIVSIARRIYSRIINLRMSPYTKIHSAQKGFRGGFGLVENVHLVRELIANARAENRTLYLISYDAVKAFDSVGHDHLFTAMHRMGIPVDIIDAIKTLYSGFTTQIVHKNVRTRAVNVLRGVLQGCPASPTLFNISINFIINLLHKNFAGRGYAIDDDTEVISCAFADDLLVCSDNCANAADMCTAVVEWLGAIGLSVNMSKSNAIIINESDDNIEEFRRKVPVSIMEEDEFFRYLGADVSAVAVPQFTELGAKVAHECQSILDFKYLRLMQKLDVFDSSTMSKLVYPSQIYCTGVLMPDGERTPLVRSPTFQKMFAAIWDAQTELVGLWPSSPKNFMRGTVQRRCLGLREPRWVVSNNAAVSAHTIDCSADVRVVAINKANRLDFPGIIMSHVQNAISVLGGTTNSIKLTLSDDNATTTTMTTNSATTTTTDADSDVGIGGSSNEQRSSANRSSDAGAGDDGITSELKVNDDKSLPLPQALCSIVTDDKKMKAQRLTLALRAAAADCWQRSTSGQLAGTNVSDQVLNANNWRRLYERSSDGAIRLAIKLMGEQHSLRCRGGGFIANASGEGDICRGCRMTRETTQHVLGGSCVGTNKTAIDRHDTIQHYVARMISHPVSDEVTSNLWKVTENPRFPSDYPHYKPDLLVESTDGRSCYILDPTIGFETTDNAINDALLEKAQKYQPLVGELKKRGFVNIGVTGLWFGARGILHRPTIEFLSKTFAVDSKRLYPIAQLAMGYTTYIYQRVVSDSLCVRR